MEDFTAKSVPEIFNEIFGFEAKQKQLEAILTVMEDRNSTVFVALPTGFGKSMCYLALPVILDKMDPIDTGHHIALVVSPLRSLMADQVKRCKELGISACWYQPDSTQEELDGVKSADYSVVFTSPECAVTEPFKQILLCKKYRKKLCLLAFDEAHCISEWGLDFRPAYRKVHLLVSLVTVPLMCLTATVTKNILADVLDVLAVQPEDVTMVASLPDRPNIFINLVHKSCMQADEELRWYLDHLIEKKEKAKKAIIFCRTLGDVQKLFCLFSQTLGPDMFGSGEKCQQNRLVDMFFADSGAENQEHVLKHFPTVGGGLRCLICTNAFGIGVEIPDVDYVIHWGSPASVLAFWQEVGRCARDGRNGEAHLLATKRSLVKKEMSGPSTEMVDLCTTNVDGSCVRQQVLMNLFVDGMDPFHPPTSCTALNSEHSRDGCVCKACMCCSICRSKCPCRTNCVKSNF